MQPNPDTQWPVLSTAAEETGQLGEQGDSGPPYPF